MPYGLLGILISLFLLVSFLLSGDASIRSKLIVAALFAMSVLLQRLSPPWVLAGFLLQMVLAIGIAIHLKGKG